MHRITPKPQNPKTPKPRKVVVCVQRLILLFWIKVQSFAKTSLWKAYSHYQSKLETSRNRILKYSPKKQTTSNSKSHSTTKSWRHSFSLRFSSIWFSSTWSSTQSSKQSLQKQLRLQHLIPTDFKKPCMLYKLLCLDNCWALKPIFMAILHVLIAPDSSLLPETNFR